MSEMVHGNDAHVMISHCRSQVSTSKGDPTAASMHAQPIADRSRHSRSSLSQLQLNAVSEVTMTVSEISVLE